MPSPLQALVEGVAADQMLLRPRIYTLGGTAGIARLDARLAEVRASAVNSPSLQVSTDGRPVLIAQANSELATWFCAVLAQV